MLVDYRRKSSRKILLAIGLAITGLADSLYLSWLKLTGSTAICSDIGDCDVVNNSPYSEIGGIPVALLGAAVYLHIVIFLYAYRRSPQQVANVPMLVFGLTLVGVLYSAYLTYLEIAVIKAICPFCVVSAIIMTFMLPIVIGIFRESEMPL